MQNYLERTSLTWSDDSIRLINTPSQQAKASYFYIQEAGYFKTNPPYFTERAGLSSFLIVYTISGRGILKYGGNDYSIGPGQCFFINCMEHHHYACLSEGWEFLWIHFYGNSSLGYYHEFIQNGFQIINIRNIDFFQSTMQNILLMHQQKSPAYELKSASLILNLLTELVLLNTTTQSTKLHVPAYVNNCCKYIDTHFKDEVSLETLATLHHISKYHLSREFKRHMGITFQDYIIGTRITYAKELLKYTDLSINEIAFACGMHNVSHFINLFKSRENSTPLAYRQKWKE